MVNAIISGTVVVASNSAEEAGGGGRFMRQSVLFYRLYIILQQLMSIRVVVSV